MKCHKFSVSILSVFMFASIMFGDVLVASEYAPKVGQQGKDVVWVPTSQSLVDKMLDMAQVTSDDYLIDLGSGDGRTVISAAKLGARALGIEYDSNMVALSKRNALKEGVAAKAQFIRADLFAADLSQATVITMFLLTDINLKLRSKLLDLKPGTRIVSNSFDLGEWKADAKTTATNDCSSYCTAYMWIVPAKVQGVWNTPQGEMVFRQDFQKVSGTLKTKKETLPITEGRLNGENLEFRAGNQRFAGKVKADTINGTFGSGRTASHWSAAKKSDLNKAPVELGSGA